MTRKIAASQTKLNSRQNPSQESATPGGIGNRKKAQRKPGRRNETHATVSSQEPGLGARCPVTDGDRLNRQKRLPVHRAKPNRWHQCGCFQAAGNTPITPTRLSNPIAERAQSWGRGDFWVGVFGLNA